MKKGSRTLLNPLLWKYDLQYGNHSGQKVVFLEVRILFVVTLFINLSKIQVMTLLCFYCLDIVSYNCSQMMYAQWKNSNILDNVIDMFRKKNIHETIITIDTFLFYCQLVSLRQVLLWGQSFPFSKSNVFLFFCFFCITECWHLLDFKNPYKQLATCKQFDDLLYAKIYIVGLSCPAVKNVLTHSINIMLVCSSAVSGDMRSKW